MTENIISSNSMNNTTWNPIENLDRHQKAFEQSIKTKAKHPLKVLSEKYLKDAKQLGYKWSDLIRKSTTNKVISEIKRNKKVIQKLVKKAKRDTKQQIKYIIDEAKKDIVKQTADVLIFQRYESDIELPKDKKVAF